jgi:hypothetical protein
MTDDSREQTHDHNPESASHGSSSEEAQDEGAPSPSESEQKIADMEQGIDRVDDRIEDAEEEADKARKLDPQPFTGNQGEQQSSTSP